MLPDHQVETAFDRGWHVLPDGELLDIAESQGFHVLVTTDQNLRYQQAWAGRRLSVLVLMTTDWRSIRSQANLVAEALLLATAGSYLELRFPR
jgi:hypothetical protein